MAIQPSLDISIVSGISTTPLTADQETALRTQVLGSSTVEAFIAPLLAYTLTPRTDISQVIAFGDSLFDTGNVGRFSDGPVVPEYLADALGVGLTNFAAGGAISGGLRDVTLPNGTVVTVPGLQTQVGQFVGGLGTVEADPDALYLVWVGANDYLSGGATDPVVVVGNVLNAVVTLRDAGAQNVLLFNLPNLGELPATAGTPVADPLNALTAAHNQLLAIGLTALENVTTAVVDVNTAFTPTLAELGPAAFWWDEVHPRTVVHQRLSTLAQVPIQANNPNLPRFSNALQRIEIDLDPIAAGNPDYNVVVRQRSDGSFFRFDYDPATGLGGVLRDRNGNGRIDGLTLFLRDGDLGDRTGGPNGRIEDVGTAVAATLTPDSPLAITVASQPFVVGSFFNVSLSGNSTTARELQAVFLDDEGNPVTQALLTLLGQGAAATVPAGFDNSRAATMLGRAQRTGLVTFQLRELNTNRITPLSISNVSAQGFTLSGDDLTLAATIQPGAAVDGIYSEVIEVNGERLEAIRLNVLSNPTPGTPFTVRLEASLYREALFDNLVGFYAAERATGHVVQDLLTGAVVAELGGDRTAYLQAVRANALFTGQVDNLQTATIVPTFTISPTLNLADYVLLPFLVANATLATVNPDLNNLYIASIGVNADQADHVQLLSHNTFGFEDIAGGGDNDFDDIVLRINQMQVA